MLVELSIRNLAVIESVRISFKQGFHVLTGETGAGKSIIIDALGLIIGGRGSADLVRYGADKAEIEACFSLADEHPVWQTLRDIGIESEDEALIIRREVTAQGKSSCRINGQMVNLTMLKEIGEWLVNIHGQHEHQSLLKVEKHIDWLDLFGAEPILPVKTNYQSAYKSYQDMVRQLQELAEKSKNDLQMMDLYRFQIEEISGAALKLDEDELLMEEKRKLANAEKMFQHTAEAYDALYANQGGLDSISKAIRRLEEIVEVDRPTLQPLVEQIQNAYYQMEDAAYQVRDYRDQVEFNPGRLEQIEQRLDLISSLRRKYGENVQVILDYLEQIQAEVDLIENKDEQLQQLQHAVDKEKARCISLATELSEYRMKAAKQLALSIEAELRDLHMERTQIEVQVTQVEDVHNGLPAGDKLLKYGRNGWDQVEFLISPNPGEPLRSLHKIASGGELSRIMLAMKSIFARMDRIPVLVFDEVDTGVSGRAAQAIAEKLSILSENCQVFSITHLPQVACMADAHYEIRKEVDEDRTFTTVQDLTEAERSLELARMLGGVEVTSTTLEHAKEMLRLANQKKIKN